MAYTKYPPGEAYGARDLHNWALRRAGGWSGTYSRDLPKLIPVALRCLSCGHRAGMRLPQKRIRYARFRCSICRSALIKCSS